MSLIHRVITNSTRMAPAVLPSVGSIVSRLRFRRVALLTALDEQGSLHKAAEVMHMTQPAATKALHEMEDALGVTLFDRSPRGIEATELGRCVIRYARLIQSDVANLREELQNMISGRGGRLSIGTIMGAHPSSRGHCRACARSSRTFPSRSARTPVPASCCCWIRAVST
jgi:DNA-binding transcriptional LysR family regulator